MKINPFSTALVIFTLLLLPSIAYTQMETEEEVLVPPFPLGSFTQTCHGCYTYFNSENSHPMLECTCQAGVSVLDLEICNEDTDITSHNGRLMCMNPLPQLSGNYKFNCGSCILEGTPLRGALSCECADPSENYRRSWIMHHHCVPGSIWNDKGYLRCVHK